MVILSEYFGVSKEFVANFVGEVYKARALCNGSFEEVTSLFGKLSNEDQAKIHLYATIAIKESGVK